MKVLSGVLLMAAVIGMIACQEKKAAEEYELSRGSQVVKVLVGEQCDRGESIVAGSWDDPALEGCKEVEIHELRRE